MIKIIPPTEKDYGYFFKIEKDGKFASGFLTYDLEKDSNHRTLILTTKSALISNESDKKNYQSLLDQINLHKAQKGSIGLAKTIVNRIHQKEIHIPNTTVAVHKHGPVPVYVLQEEFEIEFNDTKRNCKLAIYPEIEGISSSRTRPLGVFNEIEFLSSLIVRLDLMFKRYFEDVAEYFFDIENHSNTVGIYRNAKEAENVLGASVESKLSSILSTTKNGNDAHFNIISKLKTDLQSEYKEEIFKAKYARYFALYFLNELYEIIGIKTKDYSKQFRILKSTTSDFSSYFENDSDLEILRNAIIDYSKRKEIGNLLPESEAKKSGLLWVNRFVDFAKFILTLRSSGKYNPHSAKIFLSSQHAVPVPERVKQILEEIISKRHEKTVEFLFVKETNLRSRFGEVIKSKIWLSDYTYAVIPKDTNDIDNTDNTFNWIAKETVHSELLRKELLFIVESNADESIKKLKNEIENLAEYLAPKARGNNEKRKGVVDKLENTLNIHFKQKDFDEKESALRTVIINDIENLIKKKTLKIIEAWLSQFEPETAKLILIANKKLKYPSKIGEATRLVLGANTDELKKKFWEQIINPTNKRMIVIDGKEFGLIRKTGKGSGMAYSENISKIIKALFPDINDLSISLETLIEPNKKY